MKLLKKLFVALLVLVSCFCLSACGNSEELLAELENAKNALSELQTKVDGLQGEIDALEGTVNSNAEAAAQLDSIKGLLADLANSKTIEATVKSAELTNNLGVADEEGFYAMTTGKEVAFEVKATLEYNGVEFEATGYPFELDYVWYNTGDHNNGIQHDEESGKTTFALPGYYQVYIDPYLGETIVLDFFTADQVELLTSADSKVAELQVSATEQLKIVAADETAYSFKATSSSNTAVVTVSATGLLTAVAEGEATVYVTASAEGKDDRKLSIAVKVLPKREASLLAGGAEGATFNLRDANLETKAKILAHLERYLLNEGASIPVINNSGMTVYSERVNFYTKDGAYVAQMGFGATMKAPTVSDTVPAVTISHEGKDYTVYRSYESADPSTLNHLNYADSVESDFLGLLLGSLISFEWTTDSEGNGNGWEVAPSMSALPIAVEKGENGWAPVAGADGLTKALSWQFNLRSDLKWENGDPIKADDFIYTFQQVLNPKLKMKRANYFYGGSAPIAGAKAYFDGTETDWSKVGVEKTGDLSFVVTYTTPLTAWDVEYAWSGFLQTPIHKATWEACLSADGESTTYGTEPSKFMASGPFKISYWEKGKEYRFVKNDQYFGWGEGTTEEPVLVKMGGYEAYTYAIVKDSNAALELFKQGKLDVTGVPTSAYEEFKDYPNVKFAPGATSFRFSVNTATQAELDAQYGEGAWTAKPILQESDFRWALYFGLNRVQVQAITKTSTGFDNYFTSAYSLVATTKEGVELSTYRDTEWGKKVYTGIFQNDYQLSENEALNYNEKLAVSLYESAVNSMLAKQGKSLADYTEEAPLKIEVELAAFDGTTWEGVLAYLEQEYNRMFNNTENLGGKVVFKITAAPQPGMDVYYVKQMTGQFDLALAGISGGTLDPMGFMECFCDDNRSGLFLNPGLDTHNANILIDVDGKGAKYWSFDALYEAYYGDVFVKNGVVSEAPAKAE